MNRLEKISITILLITIILWRIIAGIINTYLFGTIITIVVMAAIVLSIVSVCMCGVCLVRRFTKNASPYKVFGVIDIILEAFIVGYAIYDILTDTGMLAGIFGYLMLCFVAPIPVILLIADIFLYFVKSRKRRK